MIELKKEFDTKKYRMHHAQVYKDNKVVIYRITQSFEKADGISTWLEVFKYKINEPDKYHNDEWEAYPKSDNNFGVWAWSCSNKNTVKKVLKGHFNFSESDADAIIAKFI